MSAISDSYHVEPPKKLIRSSFFMWDGSEFRKRPFFGHSRELTIKNEYSNGTEQIHDYSQRICITDALMGITIKVVEVIYLAGKNGKKTETSLVVFRDKTGKTIRGFIYHTEPLLELLLERGDSFEFYEKRPYKFSFLARKKEAAEKQI